MSKLTKERLERLDHALSVATKNGETPVTVTHAELLALVAAARERDELLARVREATASKGGQHVGPSGSYHALALRAAAAEKERDELRAKAAHLEKVIDDKHSQTVLSQADCYRKGREDERRDVVAWLRDMAFADPPRVPFTTGDPTKTDTGALCCAAILLERGEHVRK